MGVKSLPKTVTRQRHSCDLNPGPSASESSTLTTRLTSHPCHNHEPRENSGTDMCRFCGQTYEPCVTASDGGAHWRDIKQVCVYVCVCVFCHKTY